MKAAIKSTEPEFRVLGISHESMKRIAEARSMLATTNQKLIDMAVSKHLGQLVEGLGHMGFGDEAGKSAKVRLPFSEQTLADLREASDGIGLSALVLLRACLWRAVQDAPSVPPKTATTKHTARKAKTARKGKSSPKKSSRKAGKSVAQ